jgi:hypothetical protein
MLSKPSRKCARCGHWEHEHSRTYPRGCMAKVGFPLGPFRKTCPCPNFWAA